MKAGMGKRPGKAHEFFRCPNCGADVPESAKFCRQCGASDDSGWGENDDSWSSDGVGSGYSPDDDFDYDEYIAREFPDQAGPRPGHGVKRWAMAVLVAIVVAAFLAMVWSRF